MAADRKKQEEIRVFEVLKTGDGMNTEKTEIKDCSIPGFEVAASLVPVGSQGGDFYRIAKLDDGLSAFIVGDVAGHDFSSSMKATEAVKYIEENQDALSHPNLFLHGMNKKLHNTLASVSRFFTVLVAIVNRNSNTLLYSGAGHPPGLIRKESDGSIELLSAKAMPLGFDKNQSFPLISMDFYVGDMLLMYTDGVSEARNTEKEEFGLSRIEETLGKNAAKGTFEVAGALLKNVIAFGVGGPGIDDRTILCARRLS
jgi:serine phosphatase RsbU (regulator of sigma subunit)